MRQITTKAIVLKRTNYQEADKIIAFLTSDHGRVGVVAKGVRRPKSKLAGGIELLSVADIAYIKGRSDLGTLTSSRLHQHFSEIVKDIDRTMLAYDCIKKIDKVIEDGSGSEYYPVLETALASLNEPSADRRIIETWFLLRILSESGRVPNMISDAGGAKLSPDYSYEFDFETMSFIHSNKGVFVANHIKFMRLVTASETPLKLTVVKNTDQYIDEILRLCRNIYAYN